MPSQPTVSPKPVAPWIVGALLLLSFPGIASSAPLVVDDPEFEGFPFRTLAPGESGGCGGSEFADACLRAGQWFPFAVRNDGGVRGSVRLASGSGAATLTLPGGGGPIGNYVSLSEYGTLAEGTVYRFSVTLGTGAANTNPEPYVSTFCDRPETTPGGGRFPATDARTVYQGTDTIIVPGSSREIAFEVAGDGMDWTCSVRLLGQPGDDRDTLTEIELERFDVVPVATVDDGDVAVRGSGWMRFEQIRDDLSNGPWKIEPRSGPSGSAGVTGARGERRLVLELADGDDDRAVTVSRPLSLVRGGRYRLCARVSNLSGRGGVLSNLLVSRPLDVPGSQGGFVLGPVDVSLDRGESERFAVDFVAPTSGGDYRLKAQLIGYGNDGPVRVAFDDVGILPAGTDCPSG